MYNLLKCPFCGCTDTLFVTNARVIEECAKFEDEDRCPCYDEDLGCYAHIIVCDVSKGGCGASSGYASSTEQAIEKWNRRSYKGENDERL